ncbi:MAG: ribosome maturation factor RimP, partial [Mycobacteriales bacterium]
NRPSRRTSRPSGATVPSRAAAARAPQTGRAADVLATILVDPLADAGFDLEDVALRRAGSRHTVAVAVDRDGGVDLDAVAAATAVVSGVLDARDGDLPAQLRGTYDLEVSSRGTSSPLTAPRHWRRSISRLVEVRGTDGSTVTGRIVAAGDSGAELDVDGRVLHVDYGEVRKAVLQLEFRRPPGLDPDSAGDPETDAAAQAEEDTP